MDIDGMYDALGVDTDNQGCESRIKAFAAYGLGHQ